MAASICCTDDLRDKIRRSRYDDREHSIVAQERWQIRCLNVAGWLMAISIRFFAYCASARIWIRCRSISVPNWICVPLSRCWAAFGEDFAGVLAVPNIQGVEPRVRQWSL